jgi:hypothetical protein
MLDQLVQEIEQIFTDLDAEERRVQDEIAQLSDFGSLGFAVGRPKCSSCQVRVFMAP